MVRTMLASLRFRVLSLVVLTVVPILGLTVFTSIGQRAQQAVQVQQEELRLARLAALDQERVMEGTRQLLSTLAQLPAVHGGEGDTCSKLLAGIVQQNQLYANLGVISLEGIFSVALSPRQSRCMLEIAAIFSWWCRPTILR